MNRAVREICDGFDARWHEEWVADEASVVSGVRCDGGEVVCGTVVEERVSDAWKGKDETVISWVRRMSGKSKLTPSKSAIPCGKNPTVPGVR